MCPVKKKLPRVFKFVCNQFQIWANFKSVQCFSFYLQSELNFIESYKHKFVFVLLTKFECFTVPVVKNQLWYRLKYILNK